jgi:hypothetical protein
MNLYRSDDMKQRRSSRINKDLVNLEQKILEWIEAHNDGKTILTEEEIKFLYVLAEKNLKYKGDKQGLTPAQRKMKESIHKKVGNSISDIRRLAVNDFIGGTTSAFGNKWDPSEWGYRKSVLPYDDDTWKKEIPVDSICIIVSHLTRMYGDEYAIKIANSIANGLAEREPLDSEYEVDVPVIRRTKKGVLP